MDLLQSQIKKHCSLALPEGLKDLMSDISREVLRAQPNNIPQFIADYLEVLLEVREKLSIACHICTDTCKIICEPELYNELKAIGLSDEDVDTAIEIVEKHWDQRNVKEQSLLIKLSEKINIDETQLPLIRDAIQKAVKLHQIKDFPSGSKNKDIKVTDGLHHTLDRYRQNKTTTEEVFMASNFDPSHDTSENEKEYVSLDFSLQSTYTGKVTFGDETVLFKSDHSIEKETGTFDGNNTCGDDKKTNDEEDDDYIVNDKNTNDEDDNDYIVDDKNTNDEDDNDYIVDDKNTNDEDDDDYIIDDKNVMNVEAELVDTDIEENILSDSQDDISSSVDEEVIGS